MHLLTTSLAIFVIIQTAKGHNGFGYNIPDKPSIENSDNTTSLSVPHLEGPTELMGIQNGGQVVQPNGSLEPCDMSLGYPLAQPLNQPNVEEVKREENLSWPKSWQSIQFTSEPVVPQQSPIKENIIQQENSKQNLKDTSHYNKQYNREHNNEPLTSGFGNQEVSSLNVVPRPRPQGVELDTQTSGNVAENGQQSIGTHFIDKLKHQQSSKQSMTKPIEMVSQLSQVTSSNMQVYNNYNNIDESPDQIEWNNEYNHDSIQDTDFNDGKKEPCDMSLVNRQLQPLEQSRGYKKKNEPHRQKSPQDSVSPNKGDIIPQQENILKQNLRETPYYYKRYNTETNNQPIVSGFENQVMEPNIQTSTNLAENNQMSTGTHFIDDTRQQQLNSQLLQITSSTMQVSNNNYNIGHNPSKVEWNNEYNHDGTQYINGPYKGDFSAIPGQPNVDYPVYSKIPNTTFRCDNQQFPGYYADVETRCQVFHVCANGITYDFLCPNGTIFHQKYLACVWWNQFDCDSALSLYETNANIYKEMMGNSQEPTEDPEQTKPNQLDTTTIAIPCSTNQPLDQEYDITTRTAAITNTNYEFTNEFNTELPQIATKFLGTLVPNPPTLRRANQWVSLPVSNYLNDNVYSGPMTNYDRTYNLQESNKVYRYLDPNRSRQNVFQNSRQN